MAYIWSILLFFDSVLHLAACTVVLLVKAVGLGAVLWGVGADEARGGVLHVTEAGKCVTMVSDVG